MSFLWCLPPHPHLVFVWFLLPFSLLSLSSNFIASNFSSHAASLHIAGEDPTFLFFYRQASFHFQFCLQYTNSRFSMLCHQMLSLAMGSNFHTVHPCQPCTTSLFVHSLVEQLYAKVVHFCSFVTKSNKSRINLHDTNHEQ